MVQAINYYLGHTYHGNTLNLIVSVDSKEFNRIKRKQDPLAAMMPCIKNCVWDGLMVRGVPAYSPVTMNQRYPRAGKGVIKLTFSVDISPYQRKEIETMGKVDLSQFIERHQDAMFATTAINKVMNGGMI